MPDTHEVVMQLGTVLKPGAEEPLRQLGRATKDLAEEERKYQALLQGRIKAYETSLRLSKDLKSAGYGSATGGGTSTGGAVSGVAGAFGLNLPTSALAAFTAAISAADHALRSLRLSLDSQGRLSQARFEDVMHRDYTSHIPIVGELSQYGSRASNRRFQFQQAGSGFGQIGSMLGGAAHDFLRSRGVFGNNPDDDISYIDRRNRLRDAQESHQESLLRTRLFGGLGSRSSALHLQQTTMGARTGIEADALMRGFGSSAGFGAAATAAMGRAGGSYGREAEQEDISRRFGLQASLAQVQIDRDAQLRLQGAQGGNLAERSRVLERSKAGITRELGGLQGQLRGIDPGSDAYTTKRLEVEAKLAELAERSKALEENKQQILQNQTQSIETQTQSMLKRNQLLLNEYQTLEKIKQAEQARHQARTERFGLLRPREQGAAIQVARKFAAGAALTQHELQFAQQHEDLFGQRLAQRGAQRGAAGMAEIERLLPELTERGRQAEQAQAQVAATVRLNIQLESQSIAQQITQGVTQTIQGILQEAKTQLDAQLRALTLQQQRGRNAPIINQGP